MTDKEVVTSSWIASLPKVELHVHLEGTIRPTTLLALQDRHGIDLGFSSLAELAAWFQFRDFPHFIETFTTASDCLRASEDFALIVREYGEELIAQNVMYAEIHFNPEPHWRRREREPRAILAEMNRARLELWDEHGLELRWIADGVRDAPSGPISVSRTVDWIIEFGHETGIVALGLGGDETNGVPVEAFADAFQRARDAGFHTVAHAGEVSGPETVRETLDVLKPERIGHGLGAAQEPAVLDLLAARRIPLELCPTSNLRTGAIGSIQELPIEKLREHGVEFSISADDPPMFGTDLTAEYVLVAEAFKFTKTEMIDLVRGSIAQSFADDDLKARMHKRLDTFQAEDQALTSDSTRAR